MHGTAAEVLARADLLAEVSEEPGRLTRRFATPALERAGELVATWMEEAGLAVRRDAAGNVLGRLGALDQAPLVLGSHLDTVPDAGRYDGPLGVLAGIAVASRLVERGLAPALEIAAFADEEGARFGVPYLGSAAYAGVFDAAWLELVDAEGVTVREAVQAAGGDPQALVDAPAPVVAGYLEAHIEQGPVLEHDGLPVGVVSAIAGQTRAVVTLRGRAAHAGTTPMAARHDALAAASEIVLAIERLARDEYGLVATVGSLDVEPGATNVVPGVARLTVDVRHPDDDALGRAVAAIRRSVEATAAERGVEQEWVTRQAMPAVEMAAQLRLRLASAVASLGHEIRSLPSGAGHDAVVLSRVCPAAMLFVRCAGGISHDPRESVAEADVAVALDVLERVVAGD